MATGFYGDEKKFPYSFSTLTGYKIPYDLRRFQTTMKIIREVAPSSGKILDVGCGGGIFVKALSKQGFELTGLEVSSRLLTKIDRERLEFELVNADAGDGLPFKDESFDVVLASDVLEHIRENRNTVREIARLLKKNAAAIITVPNLLMYDSLEARFGLISRLIGFISMFTEISIHPKDLSHLHKHVLEEWVRIIEQPGLKVKIVLPIFISPYVFERFRTLKKMEIDFYRIEAIFSLQGIIEKIVSRSWPFKMLGQSFLFIARKEK
jgi:2-polyprenyl-3-methyl-5-hydroxy-6-metoxy-1,4-benzoquinol methylase